MSLKRQAELYEIGKRSVYYEMISQFHGDALCEETKALVAAVIEYINTQRFTPVSQAELVKYVNLVVRVEKGMPLNGKLRSTQVLSLLAVTAGLL